MWDPDPDPDPDPGKLPEPWNFLGYSPVDVTKNDKMYFFEWAINCVFFPGNAPNPKRRQVTHF
jgi:hypothetical protein